MCCAWARPSGVSLLLALAACGARSRPADDVVPTTSSATTSSATTSSATASSAMDTIADAEPEPRYDLLLAHGRVIDPASGRDGVFDVAVRGGRIAKIAPEIPADRAAKVIDVAGLWVTPGLVDMHAHVFSGDEADRYLSRTRLAAEVDEAAPPSCTTTVVDAGSAGHRTFAIFERSIVARARTRVLALLNIVGEGMRGGRFEQDLGDMSAEATAQAIAAHPSVIVGIKVAHYAGPGWEPIDRAVAAGRAAAVPVMIDFGSHTPELSLEELLLRRLRPGDIFTHAFASVPGRTAIIDAGGKLRPYVRAARERGIVFDLGHGGASFSFTQARAAIAQGFVPDTLSTDMHRSSLRGSMRDLPTVLSKLLALGMPLSELIRASTVKPAEVIHRSDLGRLAEGAEADVAVLAEEQGRFTFLDTSRATIEGARRITCALTLRAGEVVWQASR